MKVQDIRKECTTATVGLSLEFSNSEIGSLSRLSWEVDNAIDKAVDQQIKIMKNFEQGCHLLDFEDDIPAAIDLRTLKKIQWLLQTMANRSASSLFDEANREYCITVKCINDSVSSASTACAATLMP